MGLFSASCGVCNAPFPPPHSATPPTWPRAPRPLKIENGCLIQLEYTLRKESGEVLESSDKDGPMDYLHGFGDLPEAIEQALEGQEKGFKASVTLDPPDAYGEYDAQMLISVPRDEFPPDAEVVKGDWIDIHLEPEEKTPEEVASEEASEEEPEDETLPARVVDITPDAISLDANHPYAGLVITFDVTVLSVEVAPVEDAE